MSQVRAISSSQKDCGKHLSDTKKRFVWNFQIDGKSYTLELVNSSLTGKRTVLLNMDQIYHQKNLLNIDFEFTQMIDGHSFRIYKSQESMIKYELRIDNRTFDQVRLGKNKTSKSNTTNQFSKKSNDPFAEFQTFAANQTSKQSKSNAFGDFDFESFSKPATVQSVKLQQKPINPNVSSSLLDFGQLPKKQIGVNDFQTNAFQTKNGGGFADFSNSFKQNQSNLLDDYNQFSTNAYSNRNHYMDLKNNQEKSDKYLGEGVTPAVQNNDKAIWGNFAQYNRAAGLATKKAMNNAAMKVNQIKKDVKGYIDSLI